MPRIAAHLGGLEGKVIAVWGLAFKPRTDDMREAPALALIEGLLAGGRRRARLRPQGHATAARRVLGDRRHASAQRSYEAVEGADALVVVTEWNEFREPDFERIKALMRQPGDLRRPQHLQPAACCASWASTTRGSAAGEGPRHRAARATSAATPSASCATPATR